MTYQDFNRVGMRVQQVSQEYEDWREGDTGTLVKCIWPGFWDIKRDDGFIIPYMNAESFKEIKDEHHMG